MNWELIVDGSASQTFRMRMDGGWLYRVHTYGTGSTGGVAEALCFVPDTDWTPESEDNLR